MARCQAFDHGFPAQIFLLLFFTQRSWHIARSKIIKPLLVRLGEF